jgi:hypothetical protein
MHRPAVAPLGSSGARRLRNLIFLCFVLLCVIIENCASPTASVHTTWLNHGTDSDSEAGDSEATQWQGPPCPGSRCRIAQTRTCADRRQLAESELAWHVPAWVRGISHWQPEGLQCVTVLTAYSAVPPPAGRPGAGLHAGGAMCPLAVTAA